jgi:hypothetical protein
LVSGSARSPDGQPVEVFGIRHHGPGSARSLLAALEDYQPDAVLIEGPADADPLLGWVLEADMVPPIALLGYAPEEPRIASFWPMAVFSPEWQAMTWARRSGVDVAFCDLPASMVLGPRAPTLLDLDEIDQSDGPDDPDDPDGPDGSTAPDQTDVRSRPRLTTRDPLGAMATAAGYDDAERWWEDVVESRLDGSSPFPLITEAMAELRVLMPEPGDREADRERRREAYMRQTIRSAVRRGRQRVAVVCGAWHAPALTWPLRPAAGDVKILRGSPRRKVTLTWVPWTHQRLTTSSGYGAGIASPGWYHHLWSAPDRPIVRWLTTVARTLRTRDLPVSSAHVIEAVRLAETLAALRGRPLAGLTEVTEATRSVLCDGDELAVRFVTDHLVVGEALGSVSDQVPTVPLEADLVRLCRSLRVRREPTVRTYDLDLRRSIDQGRSRLFHRLRLLDLDWVTPARSDVQSQGTFRETWQSRWRPEYAISLVEAAVWGTTVESAATMRVQALVADGALPELTRAVERCLLADLPEAMDRLLTALADRAALDADVVHLMDALPALARAYRYGDVRGTETGALRQVIHVLVTRTCAGLTRAVIGLDQDSATLMRSRIDAVSMSLGLLADSDPTGTVSDRADIPHEAAPHEAAPHDSAALRERWFAACLALVDRADVNALLTGRIVRLLSDADRLDDAADRVHRALSQGFGAAAKAAWVDGFFSDGALLLIHDDELRGLLNGWVAGLSETEFTDVLPLVRRTFASFSGPERRLIADRVARGNLPARTPDEEEVDAELAAPALATVDLLLGIRAYAGTGPHPEEVWP